VLMEGGVREIRARWRTAEWLGRQHGKLVRGSVRARAEVCRVLKWGFIF
jgi:hypothetical protein